MFLWLWFNNFKLLKYNYGLSKQKSTTVNIEEIDKKTVKKTKGLGTKTREKIIIKNSQERIKIYWKLRWIIGIEVRKDKSWWPWNLISKEVISCIIIRKRRDYYIEFM